MGTRTFESEVYIFVDGSNVAYGTGINNSPKLIRIKSVLEELSQHPFRVITIVDAKLRHDIDDPDGLNALLMDKIIYQAPARTQADDFLIQLAIRFQNKGKSAYIMTNDLFPLKESKGTIPRIAFMAIPMNGEEEWIFNPPLESLHVFPEIKSEVMPIGAKPREVEAVEEPLPIDKDLLETFLGFVVTYRPPLKEGDQVAFAHVSGYLHNQWDGNFCRRFGYENPKEFAVALQSNGYVDLKFDGVNALYLVIEQKLLDECESFLEPQESDSVKCEHLMTYDENRYALEKVLASLRNEKHYPTESRILIKFSKMGIGEHQANEIIESALNEGIIEKRVERLGNEFFNTYWPADERWEAVNPNDPEDRYTQEQWMDFKRAIQELPSNQKIAQTRYHLALALKRLVSPMMHDISQAELEHMVQLAVRKGDLKRVYTTKGWRINVPPDEI